MNSSDFDYRDLSNKDLFITALLMIAGLSAFLFIIYAGIQLMMVVITVK